MTSNLYVKLKYFWRFSPKLVTGSTFHMDIYYKTRPVKAPILLVVSNALCTVFSLHRWIIERGNDNDDPFWLHKKLLTKWRAQDSQWGKKSLRFWGISWCMVLKRWIRFGKYKWDKNLVKIFMNAQAVMHFAISTNRGNAKRAVKMRKRWNHRARWDWRHHNTQNVWMVEVWTKRQDQRRVIPGLVF